MGVLPSAGGRASGVGETMSAPTWESVGPRVSPPDCWEPRNQERAVRLVRWLVVFRKIQTRS